MTPDWISAVGTVLAVLAALSLFFWEKWAGRAKLVFRVDSRAPYWGFALRARPAEEENPDQVFVLRLIVENKGPATARTVEVVLHDVEVKKNDTWSPDPSFLPSTLRWTHTADRHLPLLVPKTHKQVDLGEVEPNGSKAMMVFTITPQPTHAYNLLFPGRYRFRVTVAAENSRPATAHYEINVPERWGPEEVLRKAVTIVELDG